MNSLSTWYKSGQCEITVNYKPSQKYRSVNQNHLSAVSLAIRCPPFISFCLPVLNGLLLVNWWVHIWLITLQFITERECLFLLSIIILTCSLLSYFSSAFLWNCCWHIRRWRGTRLLWSLWQTLAKNYFPIGSHRLAPPNLSWIVLATRLACLCTPDAYRHITARLITHPPSRQAWYHSCSRKEILYSHGFEMYSQCSFPGATSSLPALLCYSSA